MRKVQVRDVPDGVHATLVRRAAAGGQSLQEYVLAVLTDHAATPTVAEVVERVRHRGGSRATADDVVEAVRRGRPAA